ncbi:hypothetical protein CEXT_449091 [Caerostris extrusa]|uniref:Uncharacterized protein n=1 Tax=Caerostris extrusa TaxID=172846 RepID=A0AAV4TXL5_CAEEX|nr:hypothetical protein CEXT_449091 [Caerostris extrusa]
MHSSVHHFSRQNRGNLSSSFVKHKRAVDSTLLIYSYTTPIPRNKRKKRHQKTLHLRPTAEAIRWSLRGYPWQGKNHQHFKVAAPCVPRCHLLREAVVGRMTRQQDAVQDALFLCCRASN